MRVGACLLLLVVATAAATVATTTGSTTCSQNPQDPCCNLPITTWLSWADLEGRRLDCKIRTHSDPSFVTNCVICGTSDPTDTADAKAVQGDVDTVIAAFTSLGCWGRQVATNGGLSLMTVPSAADFAQETVCVTRCNVCQMQL